MSRTSAQNSREVATRCLKQVCAAVAILLVLYGIVQLLNSLLDLANVHVGYYFWVTFQIIVAILVIFIGFRVYSVAKTLKVTNPTQLWREVRSQFSVLLLGCVVLLAVASHPSSASTRASCLSNPVILDRYQHTAFIPRYWTESPTSEGEAVGFLYSSVTLENNRIVPHSGVMVFLWGNYAYRLFDMNTGDVYFTTEDARSRDILLSPQRPFYLVCLRGARPKPYSFWSRDALAIMTIQIVEGCLQYPFATGDLVNVVVPAWNVMEARYSSEIESIIEELDKNRYNTVKVFVFPFWFESEKKLEIVIQKIACYEGMLEWYVPPIYLLTVCFVFNNKGGYMRTYVVPPS